MGHQCVCMYVCGVVGSPSNHQSWLSRSGCSWLGKSGGTFSPSFRRLDSGTTWKLSPPPSEPNSPRLRDSVLTLWNVMGQDGIHFESGMMYFGPGINGLIKNWNLADFFNLDYLLNFYLIFWNCSYGPQRFLRNLERDSRKTVNVYLIDWIHT